MTNKEKYKEVFGMEPDLVACPTNSCDECPVKDKPECTFLMEESWWSKEYKEPNNE